LIQDCMHPFMSSIRMNRFPKIAAVSGVAPVERV
jgi:hypothetical protein